MNPTRHEAIRELLAELEPSRAAQNYYAAISNALQLPMIADRAEGGKGTQESCTEWARQYLEPPLTYDYDPDGNPCCTLYAETFWTLREAFTAGAVEESPEGYTVLNPHLPNIEFTKPDPAIQYPTITPGAYLVEFPLVSFLEMIRDVALDWASEH